MRLLFTLLTLLVGMTLSHAKNLAIPEKDPAITISVPDSWKVEEITYGYSAVSPGKDVFFSVESASARNVPKLMADNDKWMKENDIKKVDGKKLETTLNTIPCTVFQFDTTDSNGKTTVEFILMPAGKERMIMITLWGSDAERTKHGKDIDAIMSSVKPIN